MGKKVDFLADVQKGATREGADIEFIPLADRLFPLDKLHLLLDDLDGGIQLIALTAQLLRLLGEHLQVITKTVAVEKSLDLNGKSGGCFRCCAPAAPADPWYHNGAAVGHPC